MSIRKIGAEVDLTHPLDDWRIYGWKQASVSNVIQVKPDTKTLISTVHQNSAKLSMIGKKARTLAQVRG